MDTENQAIPPAPVPPEPHQKRSGLFRWGVLIAVAAAIIVGVVVMKSTRGDAATPTAGSNELTVAAFRVGRRDLYREVNIPAEFRPYTEVELHAKVSGYLDKINVDFGDKVKAGQLLATLEVPELHDQTRNARAMQQK